MAEPLADPDALAAANAEYYAACREAAAAVRLFWQAIALQDDAKRKRCDELLQAAHARIDRANSRLKAFGYHGPEQPSRLV